VSSNRRIPGALWVVNEPPASRNSSASPISSCGDYQLSVRAIVADMIAKGELAPRPGRRGSLHRSGGCAVPEPASSSALPHPWTTPLVGPVLVTIGVLHIDAARHLSAHPHKWL
jgi:hypothetical protein